MREERLIDPLRPILREWDRRRIREVRKTQTRPWPLGRLFNQAGADGIAEYVSQDREEMAILLGKRKGDRLLFFRGAATAA